MPAVGVFAGVRPKETAMTVDRQPVVVGVDGSAGSLAAIEWAADEAAATHAPVRLVYGFEAPAPGLWIDLPPAGLDLVAPLRAARQILADTTGQFRQAHPELP